MLNALNVDSFTLGTPGTVTHVFSYLNTLKEIAIVIVLGIPIDGGLVGLVISFVQYFWR